MSCGCFPVVSIRAALPEVVGQVGEIAPELTAESVAAKVLLALSNPDFHRAEVRARIINNYSQEIRRESLRSTIRDMLRARRSGSGAG
jgi:glycosyltransferase involved in cell wall biosynthesis